MGERKEGDTLGQTHSEPKGKYVRTFTGQLPKDINKEGDYYFASQLTLLVQKYLKGVKHNIEHHTWIIAAGALIMALWQVPVLGMLIAIGLFAGWSIAVWVGFKMLKTPALSSHDLSISYLKRTLQGAHWSFKEALILSVMAIVGALVYGLIGWLVAKLLALMVSTGGSGIVVAVIMSMVFAPVLLGLFHIISMPYMMATALVFFHNVSALDALALCVRSMRNQSTWVLHQTAAVALVGALCVIPFTIMAMLGGWLTALVCAPLLGYLGFMLIDVGLYNYRHFLLQKKWQEASVAIAKQEKMVASGAGDKKLRGVS